jgi:hypothetical protein
VIPGTDHKKRQRKKRNDISTSANNAGKKEEPSEPLVLDVMRPGVASLLGELVVCTSSTIY